MSVNLEAARPLYQEPVAYVQINGEEHLVYHSDTFNKFIDDVIASIVDLQTNNFAVETYLNANKAITAGTITKLTSWTEQEDRGGNHSSGDTTVPSDGRYLICGSLMFGVASDQDRLRVYIYINGVSSKLIRFTASGTPFASVPFSVSMKLSADDVISIHAENADNNDSVISGQSQTFLSVDYLGGA
jgi:hypothetical protein